LKQVTIKNKSLSLTVLDYGAIIQKLTYKDNKGEIGNLVVGFEKPNDYLNNPNYLGACIGRYAGRITNGSFSLDEKQYLVAQKEGIHLHGGNEGFDRKYWNIDKVSHEGNPFIQLSYISPHLEEGYPGTLSVTLRYSLEAHGLRITYHAETDKTTLVNLTNHSYFILDNSNEIDHYDLHLKCSAYVETASNLLPTGKINKVEGTPYNFLTKKKINALRLDTSFVTDSSKNFIASVSSPLSGLSIQVYSNQPAVVIYTPKNFTGICFETQNFPDAPNHSNFPSAILRPKETYHHETLFNFGFVF